MGIRRAAGETLTATDLTALMSFLLSRFLRILLISVKGRLLLKRMSLLQIPAAQVDRSATYHDGSDSRRSLQPGADTEP